MPQRRGWADSVGGQGAGAIPAERIAELSEATEEWARGRKRVALVVPDATRVIPSGVTAACVEGLKRVASVTAVVGVGLHRAPSAGEWSETPQLAELVAAGVPLVDAGGQGDVVCVRGGPYPGAAYARAVVEAEGCAVLGVVELHQYAGFSGGAKGLAVGCAAPDTIGWVHRPALLRHPGVRVGGVEGNPFRAQIDALALCLPERFEVQVVPEDVGTRMFSGAGEGAWRAAVAASQPFSDVPAASAALVHVTGGKGQNLYQASRGITQLALQQRPPIPEGAPVVLVARASEGVGEGAGERAFAAVAERGVDRLLAELANFDEEARCGGGAQRAYVMALALARHPVGLVTEGEAGVLEALGCRRLRSAEDVRGFLGSGEVLRWEFGGAMPRRAE